MVDIMLPSPITSWSRRRANRKASSSQTHQLKQDAQIVELEEASASMTIAPKSAPLATPSAVAPISSKGDGFSFDVVPEDVLLRVFLLSDVFDVIALAQVCRTFNAVTSSLVLWRKFAFKLLRRGRRISLLGHVVPSDLSLEELRQSVIKCTKAERNWSIDSCTFASSRSHEFDSWSFDHEGSLTLDVSSRYLLATTEQESLLGWDLERSANIGQHAVFDGILVASSEDRATNSIYCLKIRTLDEDEDDDQTICEMTVLVISFPGAPSDSEKENDEQQMSFSYISTKMLKMPFLSKDCQILSISRRMYWIAYPRVETWSTILQIIFDWDTGSSTYLDLGTNYVFGRSIVAVYLSSDGDNLIVVSYEPDNDKHFMRWYDINELQSRAITESDSSTSVDNLYISPIALKEYCTNFRIHADEADIFSLQTMEVKTIFSDGRFLPMCDGVTSLVSISTLYFSFFPAAAAHTGHNGLWRIAQFYSLTDGTSTATSFPCSSQRNIVTLTGIAVNRRPHASHANATPLLSVTSSHIAWITEQVELKPRKGLPARVQRILRVPPRKRKRRSLKVLTLPDPCSHLQYPDPNVDRKPHADQPLNPYHQELCHLARTVAGVPEEDLKYATHLDVDPAEGQIRVSTRARKKVKSALHVYQFA